MIKSREWCCQNPECQMLNVAEPVQIGETVNKDKKAIFI
jgi:hypothetical protein